MSKWHGSPAMVENGRRMFEHAERALAIPEALSLPSWADKYRKLSRKSSARPGDWSTATVEIARGPMLAADEPGVNTITLMVATQLLKTEMLLNVIGRYIHTDPGPILVVYPNESAAEAFSKERLAPMIAETPVLRRLVGDPRGRKSENTINVKHFPGGFVAMVSAASPMNLSARPVRITLLDEIDKYQTTKEGDPIILAEERTSTFDDLGTSLHIRACSPTLEETSRIYASYLASDQRRPYVNCPHCGHLQMLDFFRNVHWPKHAGRHDTDHAMLYCENPSCKQAWSEAQRLTALDKIQWMQTRTFVCCGQGQDPRATRRWQWSDDRKCGYALCAHCGKYALSNAHAGFTAGKLYSPRITVAKLAASWIEAEKDPESKQTFYNTQLALPYRSDATKVVTAKEIATRRENWSSIPNNIVAITAGVDVQSTHEDNIGRLELEIVGWDENEQSWSLRYEALRGDPAKPDVWNELDKILQEPFLREDGRQQVVLAACIDSGGHNTEEVYKFCLARKARNIWAIKGASDRGGQWSPVWPARELQRQRARRRRASTRHRYRPVIIGVNAGKEAVRQRLMIKEPGPGYCHFPAGRPAGYFDQLASEQLIVERRGGLMVRRWHLPSHLANEALDARVYAYAALQGLINDRGFKPANIARMLLDRPAVEAVAREVVAPASPVLTMPEPILPHEMPDAPPPPILQPRVVQPMLVRRQTRVYRSSYMNRRVF